MRRKSFLLLLVLAVCLPLTMLHAFIPGEKLTFDVYYGAINAAQATLEVTQINHEGKIPAYRITSNARTQPFFDNFYKVRDSIESIWDINRQSSLRFTKNLHEGTYQQYRITDYYPATKTSRYKRWNHKKNLFLTKEFPIEEKTQDIFSAFYLTRMQNLKVGQEFDINISTDGLSYVGKVLVHRIEKQNTIFGTIECLVVQPIIKGDAIFKQTGEIMIWLTNDSYKIPVKVESKIKYGKFTARLVDAANVPYQKK